MDALTAPLLHVQRSDALWLLPLSPIFGAVVRSALVPDHEKGEEPKHALLWSLGPAAITLLIAASQVFGLLSLEPESRHLIAPGWVPIATGSFEATFGLALDPLSAIFAIAILILGLAAHAHRSWIDEPRRSGAVDIALGGALLAVLADGFFGALIGGAVVAVAIAHVTLRSATLAGSAVASAALLLGGVLLFWTLGGSWGISLGFEPTYTRRNPSPADAANMDPLDADDPVVGPSLLPVVIGGAPAPSAQPNTGLPDLSAKGSVTVAGANGARVFLKGTMEPAGIAPLLRHELFAGRVDVEIERAPNRRQHYRAVDIPAGREVAFVTVGPTWNFREVREQTMLKDTAQRRFVRDLLDPALPGHRRLGRYDAITLVLALFGVAAAAPLVSGIAAGTALLVEALFSLVFVYLLARLGFFFPLSAPATALVAGAFALIALGSAVRATVDHMARSVVARVLSAQLAIGALGIAIGLPALGALHALASVFASATVLALLDGVGVRGLRRVSALADSAPGSTRALRIAAIVLVGSPVPLLGAAFTRESILGRLFVADVPFAKPIFVVMLVASGAMAYATFRAFYVATEGPPPRTPIEDADSRVVSGLLLVAAAVALVVPIVGWSRAALFGFGAERGLFDSFLHAVVDPGSVLGSDRAARFGDAGKGAELAAVGLVVAAAVFGWFAARRRYAREQRPAIEVFEPPRVPAVRVFSALDDLLFARPLGAVIDLVLRARKR